MFRHSEWAKAFYAAQKAKGKGHQAAVRAPAYKWIRIIWKCRRARTKQARTKYDGARYVECLREGIGARRSSVTGYAHGAQIRKR